ncbi:hypothetical protein AZF37_07545 [endosymbiont 'TC1' of Trimyema compressum]|uniref:DNA-formamidopyrimidine glycosylase n=1 Tax=endosymbiont 'TC1' of Trimyema compressum TaxID=243899 RepID=UPI0007F18766|nr:DNA-formamidopyrimidine glycosylase [endosymbiont 'TC1' of Trimyema compressum]AMP21034.1 hypothetical protein AZF37_07545 [endosymbiont 'TC1' of Trimyema compressum]
MPELPEVENIVMSVATLLENQQIEFIEILDSVVVSGDIDLFRSNVEGQRIKHLNRKGKYIIFEMEKGYVILHLRMTGQLLKGDLEDKHTHLKIHLANGKIVSYRDIRKFGGFFFLEKEQLNAYFESRLGLEPLKMTYEEFNGALKKAKGSIKKILLDQKIIAGIGNIYADEILFYAGIHPQKNVEYFSKRRKEKLYEGIYVVLQTAIEEGGSSIRDYVNSEGKEGGFQDQHQVYGRKGKGCYVCKTPLKKITVAGRTTVYCPQCQTKR